MSEKGWNKNKDKEEHFADNLAEDAPKKQIDEPDMENDVSGNPEESDNVSEELIKIKDSYIRLMAEYDNYQKRTLKEKADLIKNGGEKVLVGLLPVVDDFERAIQTIETSTDISAIKEGIVLIYNKLSSYLQQNGVKAIETLGLPFDADLHEAVAMVPATDDEQKGKIIDSVQTGYLLNNDKVIRHAKVVVAN